MPSKYKEHLKLILGMRETWTKINDKVNFRVCVRPHMDEFTVSKLDNLIKLMRKT